MSLAVEDWYDFINKAEQFDNNPRCGNINIRKDEHIRFELSGFERDEYSYLFHVYTYIDDIKVNYYFFTLDRKYHDSDFWQEWKLFSKKIHHPLPDSIIKQINDFSVACVNKKQQQLDAEKKEKESRNKTIWQKEEDKLKEIFKNYEQKQ